MIIFYNFTEILDYQRIEVNSTNNNEITDELIVLLGLNEEQKNNLIWYKE